MTPDDFPLGTRVLFGDGFPATVTEVSPKHPRHAKHIEGKVYITYDKPISYMSFDYDYNGISVQSTSWPSLVRPVKMTEKTTYGGWFDPNTLRKIND